MRILLIHDFYQQFGGADWMVLQEQEYLGRTDEVYFYSKHNKDVDASTLYKKVRFAADTLYCPRTAAELRGIVQRFVPDFAYVYNVYPLLSPAVFHVLHSLRVPILQNFQDFRIICPNGLFFTKGQTCERCIHGNFLHAVSQRCYKESYALSSLYAASVGLYRLMGALRKVNAYLFCTPFAQQKFIEAGVPTAKAFIKPNYVDASNVKPSSIVGSYAAFLGRLSPEKGLWTLVRAFETLPHRQLKIAGRGPVEDELRRYIHERGITNIELVGFKTGEEKATFLRDSAFAIMPSECYEQQPVSTLEAFTVGKPVISSDLGSSPYIIEDGKNGLLYKVGVSSDLASKSEFLFDHSAMALKMGQYGRYLIDTVYSPGYGRNLLVDIFRQVSSNEGGRRSRPNIMHPQSSQLVGRPGAEISHGLQGEDGISSD